MHRIMLLLRRLLALLIRNEGPGYRQPSGKIKVGIITDWERRQRGNAWREALEATELDLDITDYPIADLITSKLPTDSEKLRTIDREDVLILNWDVANGDPEFGAHLCQRWLDHRRPELINWVRKGNIMLIESQTTLGVPCQAAYDAAVGRKELLTSVPHDARNPAKILKCGRVCVKTSRFPRAGGFEKIDELEVVETSRVTDLPGHMSGLLNVSLGQRRVGTFELLYRGWFRRTLPFRRWLPWVPIIETPGPWWKRHATMQVARVGGGAIFASTMILSGTNQIPLLRAILRCVDATGHLPDPPGFLESGVKFIRLALAPFSGLIAGLLLATPLLNRLPTPSNGWDLQSSAWVKALLTVLIGIVAVLLLKMLYRLGDGALRRYRAFIGY